MFAFGHGLNYATFAHDDLKVEGGETARATFTETNTRDRAGADVPQVYLADAAGERRVRLLAFDASSRRPAHPAP